MLRLAAGGRLILALLIAFGIFVLSREWATERATLPRKPITKSSCPAAFFVISEKPGGGYALMAVFDYSDELKSHFYTQSEDRSRTRHLLQETWPTAETLWPDDMGVNLKIPETAMGEAERLLNEEIAEAHERLGLYPTVLDFNRTVADNPNSGANYSLIVERGRVPEQYQYRVEGDEFVPVAYIAENRLGGVLVSSFLGAVSLILILFLTRGTGLH